MTVLFHREGSPGLFDTITAVCKEAGFSPRIENEPNMMQASFQLSNQRRVSSSYLRVSATSDLMVFGSIICSLIE